MKLLATKQKQIIKFIRSFSQELGYPPSIRDIMKGCNISSTSVVIYNLNVLERARYIRRYSQVARGIELLTQPALTGKCVQVPIIGKISAGEPIPVPTVDTWDITASADTLEVPRDLTQGHQGVYALRVKGWSMIDALVNDGDIVLLEYVTTVENGEVAAIWLKSERETTLKRFYAEDGHIRLQPANSQMQPIYANPDNVDIQGRVIAVIRQLA